MIDAIFAKIAHPSPSNDLLASMEAVCKCSGEVQNVVKDGLAEILNKKEQVCWFKSAGLSWLV